MADLSKLKRRTLPAPPSPDEATDNLVAPEHAPLAPKAGQRIDGRSARRSNRTLQFATRVSPEFDDRLRNIAQRDGLMLVELLELSLEAYEKANQNGH